MTQKPMVTKLTVEPDIVQAPAVEDASMVKVTGLFDSPPVAATT